MICVCTTRTAGFTGSRPSPWQGVARALVIWRAHWISSPWRHELRDGQLEPERHSCWLCIISCIQSVRKNSLLPKEKYGTAQNFRLSVRVEKL